MHDISDDGWNSFLPLLCSPNSALEYLDIGSNWIDDRGLAILTSWLANNATLQTLKLWGERFAHTISLLRRGLLSLTTQCKPQTLQV